MTLVRYSASTCASLSTNGSLAEMLLEQMLHRTGHRPAPAEVRSWQRSLPSLTDVLLEAGLGNVEMLLEYQLPLTSKRADAVLAGRNPQTGTPSYVVVELKQWSAAAPWGRTVVHATGSRSFTQTLRKVAGNRAPRVQRLFKYFNQFIDADSNGLDVLILDEAHRIRETSVNRYTRAEFRSGRAQLDELVSAARVPVFLLDEHQVVRPGELGSVDDIEAYAAQRGLPIHRVDLDAQFRCGGSEEYIAWVLRLLGLVPGGPISWRGDPAFQLLVVESPEELESQLSMRASEGYGARMSAGYCWPWSDPRADGSLVADVKIGDWSRPWNVKGERRVGHAPPASLWATDPAGFGQVGCVYTAQGFEYDWNGVILGPDLVARGRALIARRDRNTDPDFRNLLRVADAEFDHLVRNVYKVVLTRGMLGTVMYSTDAETREFLRELVTAQRPMQQQDPSLRELSVDVPSSRHGAGRRAVRVRRDGRPT